jgi:hypothetical protein
MKTRTIEFFSTVLGVADAYPIIPARECAPAWVSRARQDYIDDKKTGTGAFQHIYQCPGIMDLLNQGFIVPMWHDVVIKTNGDGKTFQWAIPGSELIDLAGKEIVGKQETGVETLMPVRPWSTSSLIKFNMPWNVVAPAGVKFLMIPIAYPDSFEFESSIGILDPGYSSEINLQMYWNIPKGEYIIKAGTPMAQLIPISEEKFEYVCRDMNSQDEKWIAKRKYLNSSTFRIKRNLVKDFYIKHFGK